MPYFATQNAPISIETLQFSSVQSSCSILILCKPLEARSIGFLPKKAPAYRRIYPITLVLPHQTHLGAKNALFCHTKRTDQINYPCFATPNAPRNRKCLILPHQTHRFHLKPYSSVQFSPVQSSCSILILCKPLGGC